MAQGPLCPSRFAISSHFVARPAPLPLLFYINILMFAHSQSSVLMALLATMSVVHPVRAVEERVMERTQFQMSKPFVGKVAWVA